MYKLYTDGSCFPNPGVGSYAYLILYNNHIIKQESYIYESTTSNRMELSAIIEGLKYLSHFNGTICPMSLIEILTDSQYCKQIIDRLLKDGEKWYQAKRDLKNKDLIMQVAPLVTSNQTRCTKVKAHSGVPGNELVDILAYDTLKSWYEKKGIPMTKKASKN